MAGKSDGKKTLMGRLTSFWGGSSEEAKAESGAVQSEVKADSDAARKEGECIGAPMAGRVLPLSEVKDEVFSTGMLGQGIAIDPAEGKLYSPVDGEITTFFPTGHAVGLQSSSGVEVLIHVGMDTVELDGKGFTPKAEQGAQVKKGDLLLEFDPELIKNEGYSILTPVIITNTDDYKEVRPAEPGTVKPGDTVITVL